MGASQIVAEDLEGVEPRDAQLKRDLAMGEEPPVVQLPGGGGRAAQCLPATQPGRSSLFSGLSGSRQSTLAKIIYGKLVEGGSRPATLLDGTSCARTCPANWVSPSSIVTWNIRRIGYVASEITKTGASRSARQLRHTAETRRAVRQDDRERRAFIEIFVATPLDVRESRDRKGLR